MAATRYLVTATANHAEKVMSNLKSARREADLRAKGDRQEVRVVTVASGRVSYTAPAPATADEFAALIREIQEEAPAAEPVKATEPKKTAKAVKRAAVRREALGRSSAKGWELLYDKPKQGAEVGRRYVDGKAEYALICKSTGFVRNLIRLTSERGLRKTGNWCDNCASH